VIWRYPSLSSNAVHTVTLGASGVLTCTCRGWVTKRPNKPHECRHITHVITSHGWTREIRGDYVFVLDTTGAFGYTEVEAETMATVMTTTGQLEAMKASAMVAGKFGHLMTPEGFVIPEKFDAAFRNDAWVMDEKLDGHRCLITKHGPEVSTTLRSIPSLPPQIVNALRVMPDGVYDGELLVPGGISTDVPNLALRNELIFAMFDVLEVMGQPVMHLSQADRRGLLELAGQHSPDGSVVVVAQSVPSWAGIKAIWARGGEGAILKKKTGKYRPWHRSDSWLKVKRLEQHTVTVTGFEAGSLGPTAVTLFKFDDGVEGRCKTLNAEILAATAADPDSFVGKRLVIECQQRTRGAKSPRHPMFKSFLADHLAGEAE